MLLSSERDFIVVFKSIVSAQLFYTVILFALSFLAYKRKLSARSIHKEQICLLMLFKIRKLIIASIFF